MTVKKAIEKFRAVKMQEWQNEIATLRTKAAELEPKPIADAPMNGQPVRAWVETTDGSGAWFDARYLDGVWLESRIVHFNHGFVEKRATVLRPSLFVPCTPRPKA